VSKNKVDKSRRRFLKTGIAGGAGLIVAVYFATGGEHIKTSSELWNNKADMSAPNAWLSISKDGTVTIRVNHTELGQGITTALPMIVAEELEACWDLVRFEIAPAESVYKNPLFGTQMTAASTSVRSSWDILRRAGATAREMLIAAGAKNWSVPTSECRAENGAVIHAPSGRKLGYGSLAQKAATLPTPKEVRLKTPDDFKIIGQRIPRLDTPLKTTGRAIFGIDVRMPGLLTATVIHSPVFGAKVKSYDASRARAIHGVRHVLAMNNWVAVVGDTFWQANEGADVLKIEWDKGGITEIDSDQLSKRWAQLALKKGKVVFKKGDTEEAMSRAARTVQAVYELPYQAHATPEPMNCTAYVRKDRCDVWAPTQHQDAAQETAARITGMEYKDVHIHTPFVGGGFGRRIAVDYVAEAVQISNAIKAPVKVIWNRSEDIQHDLYRPATYNVLRAEINDRGFPIAWTHRIVGPDHMAQRLHRLIPSMLPYWVPRGVRNIASSLAESIAPRLIPGKKASEGAAPLSYAIDNVLVNYVNDDPGIPTGFWRSVAYSLNTFCVESFIDELAVAAGKDPFEFRMELLKGTPRLQKVLQLAAEKARWRSSPPEGHYRGIAALNFHQTMLAFVVEISVDKSEGIRVHRVICALDCGIVINPKIIKAQIRGCIAFGLTAALKSEITIRKSRVVQSNFDDFPLLRMDEMPEVEVHIVPSTDPPHGIGESAVPLIGPAVANAVYAATGKRIRKLPIYHHDLQVK
jgi:isoquinoline 1-oxidoreductase beta subunit